VLLAPLLANTREHPDFAQGEAYLAEMRRRLAAERAELEQIKAQTGTLVQGALEELDVAQREVALINQIVLPQDRSAYDTTLSSYSAGKASFVDLLETERTLLRARLELHEARRGFNQAVLDVVGVRGTFWSGKRISRFVRRYTPPLGRKKKSRHLT